jgi:hypothetical protein
MVHHQPGAPLVEAARPPHRHRSGRTSAATTTRVKKTNRSTLSLSVVGGVLRRLPVASVVTAGGGGQDNHHHRLVMTASCDNLILYPGVSRARDRRERGRWKQKRKGLLHPSLHIIYLWSG